VLSRLGGRGRGHSTWGLHLGRKDMGYMYAPLPVLYFAALGGQVRGTSTARFPVARRAAQDPRRSARAAGSHSTSHTVPAP
jgi:hypothetical protein